LVVRNIGIAWSTPVWAVQVRVAWQVGLVQLL
jgi:hypothetical protein